MKPRGLILGLILAAIAQFLAMLLAGAGHGWVSPLLFSVALWIFIPSTLLAMRQVDNGSRNLMLGMAAVALAADVWLIIRSMDESRYIRLYVDVNGALGLIIILLWLGLWLFWQGLLVRALLGGRKGARKIND